MARKVRRSRAEADKTRWRLASELYHRGKSPMEVVRLLKALPPHDPSVAWVKWSLSTVRRAICDQLQIPLTAPEWTREAIRYVMLGCSVESVAEGIDQNAEAVLEALRACGADRLVREQRPHRRPERFAKHRSWYEEALQLLQTGKTEDQVAVACGVSLMSVTRKVAEWTRDGLLVQRARGRGYKRGPLAPKASTIEE